MELAGALVLVLAFVAVALAEKEDPVLFRRRPRRDLAEAPPTRVRDVVDGSVVRLVGTVKLLGEPNLAPLSQRPCTYYDLLVTEGRFAGGRPLVQKATGFVFLLVDETGSARVTVESAEVEVVRDVIQQSGGATQATRRMEGILARSGIRSRTFFGHRHLRFEEGVLKEGDRVTVTGLGRWEPDPHASTDDGVYRNSTPAKRLVILPIDPTTPLFVSNAPHLTR